MSMTARKWCAGIAVTAAVTLVGSSGAWASGGTGGGGGGVAVDPSTCNMAESIPEWTVVMLAGTIKAGVSPNFAIFGASACPVQFDGRIISVSTPVAFDQDTGVYTPIELNHYPYSETSKAMVIKPGVFGISNKLPSHGVAEVTQFETVMSLYMSTSFDATGQLLPDAVQLASGTSHWTQTPFQTQ
jgi:hypothetical protein